MSQITMFNGNDEIMINKKIRLIELFAGIGSQAKALKNIGADFEHYRICEFDKYAVTSYNAIHGTDFKVSDITKWHAADLGIIEKDKYEYIMSYSFPCQSLSISGKQEGMAKGSGTRSGLLWEVERILEECDGNLPQVLLMENVDAILFEKNRKHFFQWCNRLEEFGYKNYYEVLNARDYGIPQNRNRCFMVSVLGDYYYEFPKPIKLELRVKDLLEDEVPEKYYISIDKVNELINKDHQGVKGTLPYGDNEEMVTKIKQPLIIDDGIVIKTNNSKGYGIAKDGDTINIENPKSKTRRGLIGRQVAQTLNTSPQQVIVLGNYSESNHNASRIISLEGIAPTVMENHGTVTAIMEEIIPCELRKDEGIRVFDENIMGTLRTINQCGDKHLICYNRYRPDGVQTSLNDRIYDSGGVGAAVTTSPFFMPNYLDNYRIRKLMPIECFRLMGFTREDFFKVKEAGISDSQCYKQAGNSIVVDVLEAIFRNMNLKGVKRWQE